MSGGLPAQEITSGFFISSKLAENHDCALQECYSSSNPPQMKVVFLFVAKVIMSATSMLILSSDMSETLKAK